MAKAIFIILNLISVCSFAGNDVGGIIKEMMLKKGFTGSENGPDFIPIKLKMNDSIINSFIDYKGEVVRYAEFENFSTPELFLNVEKAEYIGDTPDSVYLNINNINEPVEVPVYEFEKSIILKNIVK